MEESLVTFEVAVVAEQDTQVAQLARGLARELEDAGAEAVTAQRQAIIPETGTKNVPFEWGTLLVEVAKNGLPPIIAALAGWLARRPAERVRLKWREGDREVEVECAESSLTGSQLDDLMRRLQGAIRPERRPPAKK